MTAHVVVDARAVYRRDPSDRAGQVPLGEADAGRPALLDAREWADGRPGKPLPLGSPEPRRHETADRAMDRGTAAGQRGLASGDGELRGAPRADSPDGDVGSS